MMRRTITAALVLAMFAATAPALAGGSTGHYWRGPGHGGHYYDHRGYRFDGGAFVGGLLFGALLSHLAAPRTYYSPPPRPMYGPPQPALGNCRRIYGTAYRNGRLAAFSGAGCYDAYGNLYAMPGSERFERYLD